MKSNANCDSCLNYVYDDEYECYNCEINLDEDDTERFLNDEHFNCPFYRLNDEYIIVRKQI